MIEIFKKIAININLGIRRDLTSILICAIFLLLVTLQGLYLGFWIFTIGSVKNNSILYSLSISLIFAFILTYNLAKYRPESPITFIKTHVKFKHSLRRFYRSIPILIAIILFSPAFSAMKSQVGVLSPYSWDSFFIRADLFIHGTDAWRIIHPIFGYPLITFTIGILYHVWVLLLYIGLPLICLMIRSKRLMQQFMVSYFLCWIVVGSLLANVFASVGPCFLEPMTGDAHFRPLMDYLTFADNQYPLQFLDVQSRLLQWSIENDSQLGRGISAMPSMHVSIALLFFLATRQLSKAAGWIFGAFFVIILIGSVHTGYHYAVDGYASIILTLAIWYSVGWFVRGRIGARNNVGDQRN